MSSAPVDHHLEYTPMAHFISQRPGSKEPNKVLMPVMAPQPSMFSEPLSGNYKLDGVTPSAQETGSLGSQCLDGSKKLVGAAHIQAV